MSLARRTMGLATAIPVAVAGAAVGTLAAQANHARRHGVEIPEDDLGLDGRVGGPGRALCTVWLGDSTAAGIGATTADETVARRVAHGLGGPVDLRVLGWSGARVRDVLTEQLPRLPPAPDLVFITVGANDVTHLSAPRAFRHHYEQVLDQLPEVAAVVMLGCPDFSTTPRLPRPLRAVAGWYSELIDQEIRALALEREHPFVDIHGDQRDEFHQDPRRFFADDLFHPNGDGYRLWADAVLPVALAARPRLRY